jgi:hypothetical protein
MIEVFKLDIRRRGRGRDRHIIVAGMEGMIVLTERDELRGIINERERFAV